jgi:hypothetical protein
MGMIKKYGANLKSNPDAGLKQTTYELSCPGRDSGDSVLDLRLKYILAAETRNFGAIFAFEDGDNFEKGEAGGEDVDLLNPGFVGQQQGMVL